MFRPVKIQSESGPRTFGTLEEATEYLLMNWPAYQSPTLDHARQICLDAINNKASRHKARAAFVAAAKEAGIHIGRTKIKKALDTAAELITLPLADGQASALDEINPDPKVLMNLTTK
ncbi:DUF982 domain-containing protein [Phyllobacterium ifriqiyense]|uniref:DUF982 domain-containing protein n=1 Tax=Phyllobacterium ifriqiyense TaxID=314238 RepID=UPI0033940D10